MNKPFLKAGYVGIILIIISMALIAVNPTKADKLPEGFFNPVVAFEFIRTEKEVYEMFGTGTPEIRDSLMNGLKNGTYIDFLYMAVYSVFLLIITLVCRRITGDRWFIFSSFIVFFIFISDLGENMQLLAIMSKLSTGNFETELNLLNYLTWAKWGGITCLFLSLIPFFRTSEGLGRIISVTAFLSAITGSAAYLYRSVLNEIYVLSIAVIFIMLIIFSFIFTCREHPEKKS